MESSIQTKEDIFRLIRENEAKIRSLGVRRIGLFGSFVRGEQRPESDVDLLVDFEPLRKTFDHFMELSFFLEEALKRRIELVTMEAISPHLKPHILSEVEYASLAA
jgi:predicted nucleotidyltransferase